MEDARRMNKEDEVMNMERVEMELIKKLQNTQAIQKEAYQELERALKEPSAMLTSYMKGGPAGGKQWEVGVFRKVEWTAVAFWIYLNA